MHNFNVEISDRDVFVYLMTVATEDKEINHQLMQILSSEKVNRNEMLELLLKHTKLQQAPDGLRKLFTYFQDDKFANEVLKYLEKS